MKYLCIVQFIIIIILIVLLNRTPKICKEEHILYHTRDSIIEKIDTLYINIDKVNADYEETVNTIISNTANEDYSFFTDYINRNKPRLDSIYNLF